MEIDEKFRKKLSIHLSTILRHKAIELGLQIDEAGFVNVNDLLSTFKTIKAFKEVTLNTFQMMIEKCEKNRFELKQSQGEWYIRANQGHSIKTIDSDQLMQRVQPEIIDLNGSVVHGTYEQFWPFIKDQGLRITKRVHLYFRPWKAGEFIIRNDCNIYIFIDIVQAMKDGIKFYKTKNGDFLSQGNEEGKIGKQYFKKVVTKEKEQLVFL